MKKENKAFSSIDFVGQCLVDEKRTLAFKQAIRKIVKKGDSVLDLGTGSGVLALLSVGSGARHVYAVEFDPFVAKLAKNSVALNKLKEKVSILVEDARNLNFSNPQKFNVVIAELLTTGMVDEAQVEAINNLHNKKLVDESTIFIPTRQDTYISLVNAQFKLLDLKIPMILHLWRWHKWQSLKVRKVTEKILLNSISFDKKNDIEFSTTLKFKVKTSGIINAIHLSSRTFLTKNIYLDDTEALNAPMLVPVEDKLAKAGEEIKLKVSYVFGGTYENFHVQFVE